MPKVRLTKEQMLKVYERVEQNYHLPNIPKVELQISADQIIHEPTNVEKWDEVAKYYFTENKEPAKNLAKLLDRLGIDATPAYNEVMKDGK